MAIVSVQFLVDINYEPKICSLYFSYQRETSRADERENMLVSCHAN